MVSDTHAVGVEAKTAGPPFLTIAASVALLGRRVRGLGRNFARVVMSTPMSF